MTRYAQQSQPPQPILQQQSQPAQPVLQQQPPQPALQQQPIQRVEPALNQSVAIE